MKPYVKRNKNDAADAEASQATRLPSQAKAGDGFTYWLVSSRDHNKEVLAGPHGRSSTMERPATASFVAASALGRAGVLVDAGVYLEMQAFGSLQMPLRKDKFKVGLLVVE